MKRYDDLRALLRMAHAECDRLRTDAAHAISDDDADETGDFHLLGGLGVCINDVQKELEELEAYMQTHADADWIARLEYK